MPTHVTLRGTSHRGEQGRSRTSTRWATNAPQKIRKPAGPPSRENGLQVRSFAMADKLVTVPRKRLRYGIGRIALADVAKLDRAVVVFLLLAA